MSELITTNSSQLNDNYCLIFSLNEKAYGINIDNVLEIIKIPRLDVPQQMPKHILGVITYNNMSVQVVDTNSILHHNIKNYDIDSQIIMVKTEESIFGLIADNSSNVIQLKSSNIQPLPYHSEDNLIQFMYRENDLTVSIIDINSIQNILQKSKFEKNEIDTSKLLPNSSDLMPLLEKRQTDLIKKFETGIEQIYHDKYQLVIFALSNNLYAIPIQKIKEIVNSKSVSVVKLPSKYNYIAGIINLRGDFISVFEFKKLLNIEPDKVPSNDRILLVLEENDFKIALLADEIIDIVTITQNEIAAKHDNQFTSKFITGEFLHEDKVISIIEIKKLLSDDRIYIND